MQALIFDSPGRPEDVIRLGELPDPVPDPGQVLLRVLASPVQPADDMFIGARYRIVPRYPQPAGLEGCGIVERVGADLWGTLLGTRVAFRAPGAWGELVVAPIDRIYAVPPDAATLAAAQFALNPLTAIALVESAGVAAGARVLLTAGRSVVARICAEILASRNVEADLLVRDGGGYQRLGGDGETVLGAGGSVAQALPDGAGGTYDAILDAVGGRDVPALIDGCKVGARLLSYGLLDPSDFCMPISKVIFRSLSWRGFGLDGWLDAVDRDALARAQLELWELLRRKPALLGTTNVFARQDFRAAFDAVRSQRPGGKVVFSDAALEP